MVSFRLMRQLHHIGKNAEQCFAKWQGGRTYAQVAGGYVHASESPDRRPRRALSV